MASLGCVDKHVDDFFGADGQGCEATMLEVLSLLATLTGFPLDARKCESSSSTLEVLGVQVSIRQGDIVLEVGAKKIQKWTVHIDRLLEGTVLPQKDAEKLVGRFSVGIYGIGCKEWAVLP